MTSYGAAQLTYLWVYPLATLDFVDLGLYSGDFISKSLFSKNRRSYVVAHCGVNHDCLKSFQGCFRKTLLRKDDGSGTVPGAALGYHEWPAEALVVNGKRCPVSWCRNMWEQDHCHHVQELVTFVFE